MIDGKVAGRRLLDGGQSLGTDGKSGPRITGGGGEEGGLKRT